MFFFSVVKMRPMGIYHVWHNIGPKGRKEEIKGRMMRGKKYTSILCFRGKGGCLLLVIRRCNRKKGDSLLAFCTSI